ncbi:MFS family permease [Nocardia goodfellowii]|uniref:MFS family permease n=2 Tax=Nocardia goodfellowii TaxID=882446 RepID=A0ABS4QL94_9NOCA|nr:MFS transporter [Nocardia goodfellowii]MBP2192469.1 MFS family permease [Nocardia goodfellowii]
MKYQSSIDGFVMLEVLRNRSFRRLFTAQVVALVGTGLLTVALGLLAYDLAGDAAGAILGTALAIKMVAYVAVAPVVSALTDHVPRRTLLVTADAVRVAIALLLPLVGQVWQIYVLIFVLQAASATFTPAFQSVIPSVLEAERDYTHGLSLSRLAYDLESLASPILAAVLLTAISYHSLFVGTAAGFVISALLVRATALPRLVAADRATPLLRRITAGARMMLGRPVLRGLLALNLAVAAATALVVVNTVVYVRDLLDGSNTSVALALGCYGGGSMVVALLIPALLTCVPDRSLMLIGAGVLPFGLVSAAVIALAEPATGVGWMLLASTWIVLGAGTSLINTLSARLLRRQSDPGNRTAVFTAQFSLSHACFLATYPLAGWLGVLAGQGAAALLLAVLATAATGLAVKAWPAREPSTRASAVAATV